MSNRETAMEFLRLFCAGDVGRLGSLLEENLRFRGPFHRFGTRDDYLTSLKSDPPEKCGYRTLSVTDDDDMVSIFYEYQKRDATITIAQLFRFHRGRVSEILVIFDGRDVAPSDGGPGA